MFVPFRSMRTPSKGDVQAQYYPKLPHPAGSQRTVERSCPRCPFHTAFVPLPCPFMHAHVPNLLYRVICLRAMDYGGQRLLNRRCRKRTVRPVAPLRPFRMCTQFTSAIDRSSTGSSSDCFASDELRSHFINSQLVESGTRGRAPSCDVFRESESSWRYRLSPARVHTHPTFDTTSLILSLHFRIMIPIP
jgi:hypothetical protein